jgi:outer membrane protein TolC
MPTIVLVTALSVNAMATPTQWSFEHVIHSAQQNDPWLTANKHQQQALESMSEAVNTLPTPTMTLGLANLPVDSFNFSQEAMTQVKVGVSQKFPRGDSITIKNQQLRIKSQAYPYQRQDRAAKVAVEVANLWLDIYQRQESIVLINKNRELFEQLVNIAQARYGSFAGVTGQQDIVRAQLEVTRLDDRLTQLAQQQSSLWGALKQWLISPNALQRDNEVLLSTPLFSTMMVSKQLPSVQPLLADLLPLQSRDSQSALHKITRVMQNHPAILAINKQILATKTGIQLAEQAYQPEWGINAHYGYRDDDPMGTSRSDFFSIGVSFDLPLFTNTSQDMAVKSAISSTEAMKTEKLLVMRQLLSRYDSAQATLTQLQARKSLYQKQLIPQTNALANAALTAYNNDRGDFIDVIKARIARLDADIALLAINVNQQKIMMTLNYLAMGYIPQTSHVADHNNAFNLRELP